MEEKLEFGKFQDWAEKHNWQLAFFKITKKEGWYAYLTPYGSVVTIQNSKGYIEAAYNNIKIEI